MNERSKRLYESIKNNFIWDNIISEFNKQGKGLNETIFELFIYVIDAQGPIELEGVNKIYNVIEEVANFNFSEYTLLFEKLEAFLQKLIYVADKDRYSAFVKSDQRGLAGLLKFLDVLDDEYFNTKFKTPFQQIFQTVINHRNKYSHTAPVPDLPQMTEIIWKTIFVELWVVRQYSNELSEARKKVSSDEFKEIINVFKNNQIELYERKKEEGFKYIQIEYENTQDPEECKEEDSLDVIKGTADTLLQTIDFTETPSIKIIAEAGMGKTMMMEYLNYKFFVDMDKENSTIFPLVLYCNDAKGDLKNYSFIESVYNKLRLFLDHNNYSHISEKVFFDYILQNYHLMFLIDGLNEINRNVSDKSKFIKSLVNYICGDIYKRCYFIITERYSRGANTIKKEVVLYRLSEISDEIKKQFFASKGSEKLFERLEFVKRNYDSETQRELNMLLRRPFYLSIYCDMTDELMRIKDADIPKDRKELMEFFVKKLIERENSKGEEAADYRYIKLYLIKLAELSSANHRIILTDALEGFSEVTQKYGLDTHYYSSNHVLELFEQLGFIHCLDDRYIFIEDIYSEYMDELLFETI